MQRVTRILVGVLAMTAMAAVAQAQVLTGQVIGTVTDASGGVLPGVTISLSSPQALPGGGRFAVTNETGEYRFGNLDRGVYNMTVELPGFSTYEELDLIVEVGGTTERNVMLPLASVSESITVSGESPMVDTRAVGTSTNMQPELMHVLPTHRGQFAELAKFVPGVTPNDPTGRGTSFQTMGSQNRENTFQFEGIIANTTAGGSFFRSAHDAFEEVQITTLGVSTEFQAAQGTTMTMVYKSGTNRYTAEGSVFWYPDGLLSKPVQEDCNCALGTTGFTNLAHRNISLHVGGPIRRDRIWFFAGGIYANRVQSQPGANTDAIQNLIDSSGLQNSYNHVPSAKITWQPADSLRFKHAYEQTIWGAGGIQNVTPVRPLGTIRSCFGQSPRFSNEMTYTLTSNTVLTALIAGYRSPWSSPPITGDRTTPRRNDSGTGIPSGGVDEFRESMDSRFVQTFKVNHFIDGATVDHDIKIGVQLQQIRDERATAYPSGVIFDDNFGEPDEAEFRDASITGAASTNQGFFVEDQLSFDRVSLTLGVRFDHMSARQQDMNNWTNLLVETDEVIPGRGDMLTWNVVQPRLGFNMRMNDDGTTVLRGHYARGSSPINLGEVDDTSNGVAEETYARFDSATGGYTDILSVVLPNANLAFDSNTKPPTTDVVSVGVDHELMTNLAVSATLIHKRGRDFSGWTDTGGVYGTELVTLDDGRQLTAFPRLSPYSQSVFTRTTGPGTSMKYNGVILQLDRRLADGWALNAGYTYGRARGLLSTGRDPNDNINGAGLHENSRNHSIQMGGMYEIPGTDGVLFAGQFQAWQGTPIAPEARVRLAQGRRSINITEADGTHRLPWQYPLNLRITKYLFRTNEQRLEIGFEIWNVLQRKDATRIITRNFFSSNFLVLSRYPEPRAANLVVRYRF